MSNHTNNPTREGQVTNVAGNQQINFNTRDIIIHYHVHNGASPDQEHVGEWYLELTISFAQMGADATEGEGGLPSAVPGDTQRGQAADYVRFLFVWGFTSHWF